MKRVVCMVLSACFLLLAACSAHQDEPSQDRFRGLYLAVGDRDNVPDVDRAEGSYDVRTNTVSFEGVEGYACLVAADAQLDVTAMFLGQGIEGNCSLGEDSFIEANWYLSRDENRIIRPYSVYQTVDGSLYLCKEFTAYGRGVSTISIRKEWMEKGTKSMSCNLHIQTIPALKNVVVKQFDSQDLLLETETLTQEQWKDSLDLTPAASWLVVEEHFAGGIVTRTSYTVEDERLDHSVWFLDEKGIGEGWNISFFPAHSTRIVTTAD